MASELVDSSRPKSKRGSSRISKRRGSATEPVVYIEQQHEKEEEDEGIKEGNAGQTGDHVPEPEAEQQLNVKKANLNKCEQVSNPVTIDMGKNNQKGKRPSVKSKGRTHPRKSDEASLWPSMEEMTREEQKSSNHSRRSRSHGRRSRKGRRSKRCASDDEYDSLDLGTDQDIDTDDDSALDFEAIDVRLKKYKSKLKKHSYDSCSEESGETISKRRTSRPRLKEKEPQESESASAARMKLMGSARTVQALVRLKSMADDVKSMTSEVLEDQSIRLAETREQVFESEHFQDMVTKAFDLCDIDESGTIEQAELYAGVLLLYHDINRIPWGGRKPPPSRAKVEHLLVEYDDNKNGVLERDEFLLLCRRLTGEVAADVSKRVTLVMFGFPLIAAPLKRLLDVLFPSVALRIPNHIFTSMITAAMITALPAIEQRVWGMDDDPLEFKQSKHSRSSRDLKRRQARHSTRMDRGAQAGGRTGDNRAANEAQKILERLKSIGSNIVHSTHQSDVREFNRTRRLRVGTLAVSVLESDGFVDMVNDAFDECDLDQSGFIDESELYCAVLLLYHMINKIPWGGRKPPPSREVVTRLLLEHDDNGNGILERDEFLQLAQRLTGNIVYDVSKRIFLVVFLFPFVALTMKRFLEDVYPSIFTRLPDSIFMSATTALLMVLLPFAEESLAKLSGATAGSDTLEYGKKKRAKKHRSGHPAEKRKSKSKRHNKTSSSPDVTKRASSKRRSYVAA